MGEVPEYRVTVVLPVWVVMTVNANDPTTAGKTALERIDQDGLDGYRLNYQVWDENVRTYSEQEVA